MKSTSGTKAKLLAAIATICLAGKAAKLAKQKRSKPTPAPTGTPQTPAPGGEAPTSGGGAGGISSDPARTHTGAADGGGT